MNWKKFFIFVLCVGVLVLAAWYAWRLYPVQTITLANGGSATATPSSAYVVRTPPAGFAEYHSQPYHLSIFYPSGMQYSEQLAAPGQPLFVTFQDPQSGGGFQIYILPYSQSTITPERFKLDEPSGIEQNIFNVQVAGADGIMFESTDPVVGQLREIWFIHEGLLYEVTTALSYDKTIQNIMQTWQFVP
jgi:hypothetical protein